MEKEANSILEEYKKGNLTTDKARRLLFTLCGFTNSSYCKLDRTKENCPIIQNTSFKNCEGCGHHC